ncbi:PE-PGRS family protein PE_PGRS26-like isoform X2 [Pecten maximus]|uniref:PE-PGRS family protein PE_PGRS26-like isoform X2 n=1 Tax=Pecten maximus TaxID=6579 RepID=UPI0014588F91|nr:PE-PGRS family protein PE_PGRS26-like isoform X2 [Pecten maximus]
MDVVPVYIIILLVPFCNGGVLTQVQCKSLPYFCPQWCIGTSSGCTVCDCAKYGTVGVGNGFAGLGAVSGGSGLSMINPGGMIGFGTGSQSSPAVGKFNSNLPGRFNPANTGLYNPFMTGSGGTDPSNPNGFGNPANLGMAAGAGIPSNPGGSTSVGGNPVLTAGAMQQTGQSGTGNAQGTLQQTGQVGSGNPQGSHGTMPQSGSGAGSGQQVQQVVTTQQSHTAKPSTVPSTTTTQSTTPSSTASTVRQKTTTSGACAPLRCTPPCDKGVVIAPNGCPMCLCQP